MTFDTSTVDTYSLLRDAYDAVSWNTDTMLTVLSDYLDSRGNMPDLARYISEIVQEETGTGLYDIEFTPECQQLGALILSQGADGNGNDFELAEDYGSAWVTVRMAEVYLYRHDEGLVVEVSSRDRPTEDPIGSLSFHWNDFAPEKMQVFEVHARAINGNLHELDQEVAGVYRIALSSSLDDRLLAGAALDVFHSSVAVKYLDDFIFAVTDSSGNAVIEPDNYQGYSHSDSDVDIGYLIREQ